MSTFKFNFSNNDNDSSCVTNIIKDIKNSPPEAPIKEAEEIRPYKQLEDLETFATYATIFTCEEVQIRHIEPTYILKLIQRELYSVNEADRAQSDLISGKYEGGLKIWEGTADLISYLKENEDSISLKNKNVLDLGCGAGILGIYALLNGATVTFQDYNKEILEHVTIPNILLNLEEGKLDPLSSCKFYSGDWSSLTEYFPQTYDVILTSETIYNEANYNNIIRLLTKMLKVNGTGYLAAKTHYFGVGGGTRMFEAAIKNDGSLESELCWKCTDGIQREILKIKHKNV